MEQGYLDTRTWTCALVLPFLTQPLPLISHAQISTPKYPETNFTTILSGTNTSCYRNALLHPLPPFHSCPRPRRFITSIANDPPLRLHRRLFLWTMQQPRPRGIYMPYVTYPYLCVYQANASGRGHGPSIRRHYFVRWARQRDVLRVVFVSI
jgi:hypothetical protein